MPASRKRWSSSDRAIPPSRRRSRRPDTAVTLVDVPLINPGTIRVLCERAAMTRAPIVRAVHRGRHGHPVIFKREVFDPVRRADPAIGAKAVLRAFPVEDVDIDDPGIAEDVDTPDDYRRLITIRPANPYQGSDV